MCLKHLLKSISKTDYGLHYDVFRHRITILKEKIKVIWEYNKINAKIGFNAAMNRISPATESILMILNTTPKAELIAASVTATAVPLIALYSTPKPDNFLCELKPGKVSKGEDYWKNKAKKSAKKKVKKKVAEVKKLHRELVTELNTLNLKQIKSITDIQVTPIKKVNGTILATELKKVKLFTSREGAVVGFYKEYLKRPHLLNKVNPITSIAQFIYEPGLDNQGYVSRLSSVGNMGGIKAGTYKNGRFYKTRDLKGQAEGCVRSKDDEKELSVFKTFKSIPDFMEGHADFLSTPRYKNYRKFNAVSQAKDAAKQLTKCGYFTKSDGHESLIRLIDKVVVPTLKKANLI